MRSLPRLIKWGQDVSRDFPLVPELARRPLISFFTWGRADHDGRFSSFGEDHGLARLRDLI